MGQWSTSKIVNIIVNIPTSDTIAFFSVEFVVISDITFLDEKIINNKKHSTNRTDTCNSILSGIYN